MRTPMLRPQVLLTGFALLLFAAACTHKGSELSSVPAPHKPSKTGLEYAPDMYHSIPLEPYSQYVNTEFFPGGYNTFFQDAYGNGGNAQKPVPGTIARGKLDHYFLIPESNEGYEAAAALVNPLPKDKATIAEGKRLFTLYCIQCHGKKGEGNGSIVEAGKFPAPPAYNGPLKDLPEGKAYYSITYGKNLMGSHASQLNPTERWQVIRYVQTMQGQLSEEGEAPAEATQTAQAAVPAQAEAAATDAVASN